MHLVIKFQYWGPTPLTGVVVEVSGLRLIELFLIQINHIRLKSRPRILEEATIIRGPLKIDQAYHRQDQSPSHPKIHTPLVNSMDRPREMYSPTTDCSPSAPRKTTVKTVQKIVKDIIKLVKPTPTAGPVPSEKSVPAATTVPACPPKDKQKPSKTDQKPDSSDDSDNEDDFEKQSQGYFFRKNPKKRPCMMFNYLYQIGTWLRDLLGL